MSKKKLHCLIYLMNRHPKQSNLLGLPIMQIHKAAVKAKKASALDP